MAPKMNVYEKIMTGIFKLFLLMAIGALTLSRFTGFEWLRIDGSWLTESAQELRSLRQVFATLTRIFWSSPYVYGSILTAVYAIMGVIRCPGQSWIHALVAFSVGVAKAVPICLVAQLISSCVLYWTAYGYFVGEKGDGSVLLYYAARIDVFCMKIAQAKYSTYVDAGGQRHDKKKLAEVGTKEYEKKRAAQKPVKEDWDEWAQWDMGRFQYLLWWRVFPFTPHWYMNLAGGLLGKKNICPVREFLVAAFIGSLPWVYFCCKFGDTLHTLHFEEMLQQDYVRYPMVVLIAMIPYFVNKSGIIEQFAVAKEFGADDSVPTRPRYTGDNPAITHSKYE